MVPVYDYSTTPAAGANGTAVAAAAVQSANGKEAGWQQPQPSAPVPTSLAAKQLAAQRQYGRPQQHQELPPEALAVQQLPGIGTWAGRQRLFARPADLRNIARTPSGGSPTQMAQSHRQNGGKSEGSDHGPVVLGALPEFSMGNGGSLSKGSSMRSDQAREAAWRWRFTRKWEAEQKKYYEEQPGAGSLLSNDELDAIQYTQACGMGENLQFDPPLFRSSSRTSTGGLQHSLSCQFDVSGHGGSGALAALAAAAGSQEQQLTPQRLQQHQQQNGHQHTNGHHQQNGLIDGSQHGRPPRPKGAVPWLGLAADVQQPSATSAVLSMVTKARDLLQKQQQFEQEAQSRWERSMSAGLDESWAGQRLRQVQISMSGRFRYVVLRAVDARGHQRYLVRGRSKASPAVLVEEVTHEAAVVSRREGLPQVVIELVGCGVMEWREDTDRHLHLSAAPSSGDSLNGGASGGAFSPKKGPTLGDVTGLAASLVRQVLPCHFQITTTSTPSRMASLMDTLHI
ncbi:hypothetical protein N2152v2_009781 [Parachlorella kessleri]